MGSAARDIASKVRDELRSLVDGGVDYDFDLRTSNGATRVRIGAARQPPNTAAAFAWVTPLARPSDETPGHVPLTQYGRTLTLQITGFVRATGSNEGELLLRAFDLGDDIERALESSLDDPAGLGALLYGMLINYEAFGGGAVEMSTDLGVVLMVVSCRYRETRGA